MANCLLLGMASMILTLTCLAEARQSLASDGKPAHADDAQLPDHSFVATNGNDAWSCRFPEPGDKANGPCASLDHALSRVESALARPRGQTRDCTVEVRGGAYYLSSSAIFNAADSARAGHMVAYKAYGDNRHIISGGIRLKDRTDIGGRWQTTLQGVSSGSRNNTQLWVNNSRRFRPMLPSISSYYNVASATTNNTFEFNPGEIASSWANLTNVDVTVISAWSTLPSSVASVDGTTVIPSDSTFNAQWGPIGWGQSCHVGYVIEALNQPSKWYLDSLTSVLTYSPKDVEDIGSARIVAPTLTNLVIFSQGSAIMGIGVPNVVIDDCIVRSTGNGGIYFKTGTTHTTVRNRILSDIGARGIASAYIFGSRSYPSILVPYDWHGTALQAPPMTYDSAIDSLILGVGRMNPVSYGVRFSRSNSCAKIEHKEIYDTYNNGIPVGWETSEPPENIPTGSNTVFGDPVYNIRQDVSSDMGAIYVAGAHPTTVVSQNAVHDIPRKEHGWWVLYFAQGSTEKTDQQKVAWNSPEDCVYFNHGQTYTMLDDTSVNCGKGNFATETQRQFLPADVTQQNTSGIARAWDWDATVYPLYTFERDIVVWASDQTLGSFIVLPVAGELVQDGNVYRNTGKVASEAGCMGGTTAAAYRLGSCYWNVAKQQENCKPLTPWDQWNALGYDIHSPWVNLNLNGESSRSSIQNTSVIPAGFQKMGS